MEEIEYNPHKNPKAISLIQQEDGNWIGTAQKYSQVITVREGKPEDCLVKLITHDGGTPN